MEYIQLNDKLSEKLYIVRFNIDRANEEEITIEDTIEILIELYWNFMKQNKIDYNSN